mgnify:CR=1 FL=1
MSMKYGRHSVLNSVSFSLNEGESLAIIGENGCGKSTLLKICAGIITPSSGTVTLSGRVGFCPQTANLGAFLTADDHYRWFGASLGLSYDRTQEEVSRIGHLLGNLDNSKQVRHLSGGNVQKLNLACATLDGPKVLLLDEPYQGFDEGSYLNFWNLVDYFCEAGIAVIVVTHLLRELNRVNYVLDLGRITAAKG